MRGTLIALALVALLVSACGSVLSPGAAPTATPTATLLPTATLTLTATPTDTPPPTATPTSTVLLTVTPLPRRLSHGEFITQAVALDGYGELVIENGTELDAVIALTTLEDKLIFSVYVQAYSMFNVAGIRDGTYKLFFMTGEDWDDAAGRFTRKVSYRVFEELFPYTTTATEATIWTVTLHPVVGGTAQTEQVQPDEFPPLK